MNNKIKYFYVYSIVGVQCPFNFSTYDAAYMYAHSMEYKASSKAYRGFNGLVGEGTFTFKDNHAS